MAQNLRLGQINWLRRQLNCYSHIRSEDMNAFSSFSLLELFIEEVNPVICNAVRWESTGTFPVVFARCQVCKHE